MPVRNLAEETRLKHVPECNPWNDPLFVLTLVAVVLVVILGLTAVGAKLGLLL